MNTPLSEDHGLELLTDNDLQIYSVGISTGGIAEMRMAKLNPNRHIIATTIDEKGLDSAKKDIAEANLGGQLEAKIEDVSQPLPYPDGTFDYIYARLVLHYFPKNILDSTLTELHRILKVGGKIFIVVRSVESSPTKHREAIFDPETYLTTYEQMDEELGNVRSITRYFHTEESLTKHVMDAGFSVAYAKTYEEKLYTDFLRTKPSPETEYVIELLGVKSE